MMNEKEGAFSETTGTDMGDRSYVMDVHLKRQYIGTYIGQLKGGHAVRGARHQRTAPEDSITSPKLLYYCDNEVLSFRVHAPP